MVRFLGRRLVQLIIVIFAVTLLTSTLLRLLPGDPAVAIAGTSGNVEEVRQRLDLNESIPVAYVNWMKRLFTGDFGTSVSSNVKISTLLADRLPVTLYLMLYAMVISLAVAIPLGIWTAYRANRLSDRLVSTASFGLLSLPPYITGVLFVYLFAVRLAWFPAISTYVSPWSDPVGHFKAMALPALTLALGQIAVYQRLLRADMVSTLQNDFITLARAKGLSTPRILFRHALRPSTFSLITAAAINVGALIGGAVVVEQIFALPGMGSLTVASIIGRDFDVVQLCVLIFAVGFVLVNFFVDLLYNVLDPRIRHARALA
jgi:peptide/nickel transport system permease protein